VNTSIGMDKQHLTSVRIGKVTRYPRSVIHKGVDGKTGLGSDLVTGIQGDRDASSDDDTGLEIPLYPCHGPVLGPNHSKLLWSTEKNGFTLWSPRHTLWFPKDLFTFKQFLVTFGRRSMKDKDGREFLIPVRNVNTPVHEKRETKRDRGPI